MRCGHDLVGGSRLKQNLRMKRNGEGKHRHPDENAGFGDDNRSSVNSMGAIRYPTTGIKDITTRFVVLCY